MRLLKSGKIKLNLTKYVQKLKRQKPSGNFPKAFSNKKNSNIKKKNKCSKKFFDFRIRIEKIYREKQLEVIKLVFND